MHILCCEGGGSVYTQKSADPPSSGTGLPQPQTHDGSLRIERILQSEIDFCSYNLLIEVVVRTGNRAIIKGCS